MEIYNHTSNYMGMCNCHVRTYVYIYIYTYTVHTYTSVSVDFRANFVGFNVLLLPFPGKKRLSVPRLHQRSEETMALNGVECSYFVLWCMIFALCICSMGSDGSKTAAVDNRTT